MAVLAEERLDRREDGGVADRLLARRRAVQHLVAELGPVLPPTLLRQRLERLLDLRCDPRHEIRREYAPQQRTAVALERNALRRRVGRGAQGEISSEAADHAADGIRVKDGRATDCRAVTQ